MLPKAVWPHDSCEQWMFNDAGISSHKRIERRQNPPIRLAKPYQTFFSIIFRPATNPPPLPHRMVVNQKQEWKATSPKLISIYYHFYYSQILISIKRKKGRDLTQSYDKNPYTNRNVKSDNIYNATKKFDYTAVADRLRTISCSNYGHPTGVVNLVYGPDLPIPRNSRVINRTHV